MVRKRTFKERTSSEKNTGQADNRPATLSFIGTDGSFRRTYSDRSGGERTPLFRHRRRVAADNRDSGGGVGSQRVHNQRSYKKGALGKLGRK